MGLAASQARYLALTARKNDLEFQSQTINTRRVQLAYRTAEIARVYAEGMNNQQIMMRNTVDGKDVWEELSFKKLLDSGFVVIPAAGQTWSDIKNASPYQTIRQDADEENGENLDIVREVAYYMAELTAGDMSEDEAKECLTEFNQSDFNALFTQYQTTSATEKDENGQPLKVTRYKFNADGISTKLYDKLTQEAKAHFSAVEKGVVDLKLNYDYNATGGVDIQSLLTSGKAQIVSKAFFDYLVTEYGYNPQNYALPGTIFSQAQTRFEQDVNHANVAKENSIYDWGSDEQGIFKSRTFTEDDEKTLREYEAATAEIQAQDRQLEIQEKNIETQHKAVETELDDIKKVIQGNIEKTFKIFS